jgi:radical SAM protein with 4Fe4S-binding SPASM domain
MAVAQWAQTTHNLMVGFHLYSRDVARGDVRPLAKLNPELTRVFVETDQIDKVRFIEDLGVRVLPSDNIDKSVAAPTCDLPKSMTCVCSEGGLYTCGRVAGEQHYHMGNFLGRKLKAVMNDESVPHQIFDREAETPERCSGCPPLMAQRIHEDTQ